MSVGVRLRQGNSPSETDDNRPLAVGLERRVARLAQCCQLGGVTSTLEGSLELVERGVRVWAGEMLMSALLLAFAAHKKGVGDSTTQERLASQGECLSSADGCLSAPVLRTPEEAGSAAHTLTTGKPPKRSHTTQLAVLSWRGEELVVNERLALAGWEEGGQQSSVVQLALVGVAEHHPGALDGRVRVNEGLDVLDAGLLDAEHEVDVFRQLGDDLGAGLGSAHSARR